MRKLMVGLFAAVILGTFAATVEAQDVATALGQAVLLSESNRDTGPHPSNWSAPLTAAMAPAGTEWIVLRVSWNPALVDDPTVSLNLWAECLVDGVARRIGAGGLFIGGPGQTDNNGDPLLYPATALHKSQVLGLECRAYSQNVSRRFRYGLVLEFYGADY